MAQPQRVGGDDRQRRRRLALAGQDVEYDVASDRAAGQRRGARRVDGVGGHRGQDADHLAIAVGMATEVAAHPLNRQRQRPVLERRAVPERTRLALQHRQVMRGIVDDLLAPNLRG